jgi:hypothetical protein
MDTQLGTAYWYLIGYYLCDITDINGFKSDLMMEIISHSATNINGSITNRITILHFKTANSTGSFKGDCADYVLGGSLISPYAIKIAQQPDLINQQNVYYFYAYFGGDSEGTVVRVASGLPFEYQGTIVNDINSIGSVTHDVPIFRIFNSKIGIYQSDISGLPQRLTDLDNTLANNYFTKNQLNNWLIGYDENSGSHTLNSRLVIKSATSGGGVVRILEIINDG